MEKDIKIEYDKDVDIMSGYWGERTEYSAELFNGGLILDFDKKDNIIGFEIMDFYLQIKESQKKLDKIFKTKRKTK